jgi:hypothetical protein
MRGSFYADFAETDFFSPRPEILRAMFSMARAAGLCG